MRFIDKVANAVIETQGDARAVLDINQVITPRIHPITEALDEIYGRLDDIDTNIGVLTSAVADLADRVDALENVEPEPEPEPEPPPVVVEEYPANPDIVLSPGQAVQPHLTAGAIVELLAGDYGDQQLAPADSAYVFSRGQATFTAPTTGQKTFIDSGGNNVTLRGLKVDGYGQTRHQGDGAIRFASGASGWTLIDVEILRAAHSGIEHRGSGHTILRGKIHDCGQYGWSGGFDGLIKDTQVWRIGIADGSELVPRYTNTSDRGVCKMAGSSSGMRIEGLEFWRIDGGKGLWWDGARDGTAKGVHGWDVDHNGVSVEVCWGGAQTAPSGHSVTWPDPAFVIEDIHIEQQHNEYTANDYWPAPSGISISMSPGVWVNNLLVEDVGTAGISVLYSAAHPVFERGFTAANPPITPAWCQTNLTNDNVRFDNFQLAGTSKRYQVGAVGGWSSVPPQFTNGVYGMNVDRFRWENNSNMTLAEWQALHP